MRILLIADYYPPRLGGVGEVVAALGVEYQKLGHHVEVATIGTLGEQGVHALGTNLLRANYRVYKLVQSGRFDLIHLHQTQLSLWLPFYRQCRVLYTFHTSAREERRQSTPYLAGSHTIRLSGRELRQKWFTLPLREAWERILVAARLADFTAITRSVITENSLPSQARVIPNGVSSIPYQPKDFTGTKRIVYAGSLRVRKRVFQLPYVLQHLQSDWRLSIIGGEFREGVLPLPNDSRITYLGKLTHQGTLEQFQSHHILCLFSTYEGMPLAAMEAMSRGCIPVVTDIPAHRCFIRHGINGWLVPVDNPVAQSNALNFLLSSPILCVTLSCNAFQAMQDLQWDRIAKAYLNT